MKEDKSNTNDPTLSVDLSEATQAVKENRFEEALMLFEIILKDHPNNIDAFSASDPLASNHSSN